MFTESSREWGSRLAERFSRLPGGRNVRQSLLEEFSSFLDFIRRRLADVTLIIQFTAIAFRRTGFVGNKFGQSRLLRGHIDFINETAEKKLMALEGQGNRSGNAAALRLD